MLEYDDKRNFRRMCMDCNASYQIDGGASGEALVKDLSAGGVLLWGDQELVADTRMLVTVKPVNQITPPLNAQVRVVRCSPCEDPGYAWAIACEMLGIVA